MYSVYIPTQLVGTSITAQDACPLRFMFAMVFRNLCSLDDTWLKLKQRLPQIMRFEDKKDPSITMLPNFRWLSSLHVSSKMGERGASKGATGSMIKDVLPIDIFSPHDIRPSSLTGLRSAHRFVRLKIFSCAWLRCCVARSGVTWLHFWPEGPLWK